MGTPRDYSITFAGAGQQSLPAQGRFCRVLAADASGTTITPGASGSSLLRFAGQDVDAGLAVREWLIAVTVASTVRVCVSDTRQADNTTNVAATVTATVAPGGTLNQPGDVACANGVATQVLAGNANRLSALVGASAAGAWAAGSVRVGTTAVGAATGIELNPGDRLSVAYTGPVFVYNNSGAAINLQTLEIAK